MVGERIADTRRHLVQSLILTFDNHVINLIDDVDVVPIATDHIIRAGSAVDQIGTLGSKQTIIARIAANVESIDVRKIAINDVISVTGVQSVDIFTIVDIQVCSGTDRVEAQKLLVHGEADDIVGRRIAIGIDFDRGDTANNRIFDLSSHAGEGIDHLGADAGRTIRLPVHMTSAMWALNQARNRFLHEHYREPTTEELAETAGVPLEEARAMRAVARSPASLDRPISDTDDTDLGDFVEDNGSARPSEVAANKMLSKEVNQVLETLTYREREILKLRYGIGDGYPYTLEQVGLIFGVTRERVRQIEAKAFDKLQDPRRRARLAGFLSQSQLTGLAP